MYHFFKLLAVDQPLCNGDILACQYRGSGGGDNAPLVVTNDFAGPVDPLQILAQRKEND